MRNKLKNIFQLFLRNIIGIAHLPPGFNANSSTLSDRIHIEDTGTISLFVDQGHFYFPLTAYKLLRNNIGGGDIKMLSALFIYLSLDESIMMIEILSITSLIYAIYLLLIKKKNKDYKFSYGEFISLSTIITIIYGGN